MTCLSSHKGLTLSLWLRFLPFTAVTVLWVVFLPLTAFCFFLFSFPSHTLCFSVFILNLLLMGLFLFYDLFIVLLQLRNTSITHDSAFFTSKCRWPVFLEKGVNLWNVLLENFVVTSMILAIVSFKHFQLTRFIFCISELEDFTHEFCLLRAVRCE